MKWRSISRFGTGCSGMESGRKLSRNSWTKSRYILSQSMFPRVPVPGFRKVSDFVCEPIHVDYPEFINLEERSYSAFENQLKIRFYCSYSFYLFFTVFTVFSPFFSPFFHRFPPFLHVFSTVFTFFTNIYFKLAAHRK